MATYRWRIDFSLPGVPIAQPMTLDAITLTPAPRDQKGRSLSNGYLQLDIDQYLQDSDVETQAMSQLERIAIAAAALGGSTRKPIVNCVRLDNRDELEAVGLRTPLQNATLRHRINVIAPNIEEPALTHGYRTVLAFGGEDLLLWLRVARWLWKANSDADPYDQFLALWICFNVLYGRFVPNRQRRGSQRTGIKNYLAQEAIPTETDASTLRRQFRPEDLSSLAADQSCPTANELQTALGLPVAQQSNRELIKLIFLVIYEVRCAIVHEGGVALSPDTGVRLVFASRDVLKSAIMHLLRRRLGL